MKNNKFSIIIPMYNSKEYIEQCIDSVLNQKYKYYEIIVIDDGSTDNSFEYVNNKYIFNKNIKIYRKNNSGVSDARNFGIEKSSGDWITFLDSDDYLLDGSLNYINYIINKNVQADVIIANISTVNNAGKELKNRLYDNMSNFMIEDDKTDLINSSISISNYGMRINQGKYGNSRCIGSKFYKRKLIVDNNIKFINKLITFEDGLFNIEAYLKSNKIIIDNKKIYAYRQNENSVTNKKNIEKTILNSEILLNIIKKKYLETRIIDSKIFIYLLDETVNMVLNQIVKNKRNDKTNFYFNQINEILVNNFDYNVNCLSKFRLGIYKLLKNKKYNLVYVFYFCKYQIKKII